MDSRSQRYYEAGLFLLSKQKFDQSIVCFYYSVLQRMMYSLTVSKVRPVAYENQNPLDENLPIRILEEIKLRIDTSYRKDASTITELFQKNLLPARKKADYQAEYCTLEDCLECREQCERLNSILKKLFNNRGNS